jgi:hypothetical protein
MAETETRQLEQLTGKMRRRAVARRCQLFA